MISLPVNDCDLRGQEVHPAGPRRILKTVLVSTVLLHGLTSPAAASSILTRVLWMIAERDLGHLPNLHFVIADALPVLNPQQPSVLDMRLEQAQNAVPIIGVSMQDTPIYAVQEIAFPVTPAQIQTTHSQLRPILTLAPEAQLSISDQETRASALADVRGLLSTREDQATLIGSHSRITPDISVVDLAAMAVTPHARQISGLIAGMDLNLQNIELHTEKLGSLTLFGGPALD